MTTAAVLRHGQWDEEVASKALPSHETVLATRTQVTDTPAPETAGTSEKQLAADAVETPVSSAPDAVKAEADHDDLAKVIAKAPARNSKTLAFKLDAGRALSVRCVDAKTIDDVPCLVVVSITQTSPLATTSLGQAGLSQGDVVLEINGQDGQKVKLLDALQETRQQGGQLDLLVCSRPTSFWVKIERTDPLLKMGVALAVHDDIAARLEVQIVCDEGAVANWNGKNALSYVCDGDWITAVTMEGSEEQTTTAGDMIVRIKELWAEGKSVNLEVNTTFEPVSAR